MVSGYTTATFCLLLFAATSNFAIEHEPNKSQTRDAGCTGGEEDGKCSFGSKDSKVEEDSKKKAKEWKPFRLESEDKWISFERLIEKYSEWHAMALSYPDVHCTQRKVLVFEPNAGLGDSIGALTSGFMYAMRAGRIFLINWKPFKWNITFKKLPFMSDYFEVSKLIRSTTKEPIICPDPNDKTSFLMGHVTTNHPIVTEAQGYDFNTDYSKLVHFFIQPSEKVQELLDGVMDEQFKKKDDSVIQHKVAIVMRTGIGEYNQFLSVGDEKNFITCFKNYARRYQEQRERRWRHDDIEPQKIKFSVLITSDNEEAKQNVMEELRKKDDELDIDVIALEDSIVHVMHMTSKESKEKRMRDKIRKTVAEFFLISMCDVRFLTHGSLFGRAAAERAGDRENTNFYISDSNCDGKREKHSYLQCHSPKYPPICGLV